MLLRVYYNKIPINPIFYLLKGDYNDLQTLNPKPEQNSEFAQVASSGTPLASATEPAAAWGFPGTILDQDLGFRGLSISGVQASGFWGFGVA